MTALLPTEDCSAPRMTLGQSFFFAVPFCEQYYLPTSFRTWLPSCKFFVRGNRMDDLITRFWSEIAARPIGPMAIRLYLQPIMATIFAIRDGWHDAEQGKPAYFWAL